MNTARGTIAKRLEARGIAGIYTNILEVSDALEQDYDREDYGSVTDAVDDCIEDLAARGVFREVK